MKKLVFTLFGIFIALTLFAQTPQSFNYQAALRDDAGEVITKQAVEISLSILKGSVDGAAVYTEVHNTETNAFGLVNLQIGQGTSSDDFASINWVDGPYFIRVSLNGTEMGASPLLSVPYALYAEQAGNTFSGSYNDLTDIPANLDPANNFSGNFNDLSGIPENLDTDSTDDFSGSFNDLTDIPENLDLDGSDDFSSSFNDLTDIPEHLDTDTTDDFSGDYNDLINKPRIPVPAKQAFSENDSVAFINDKKVGIGTEQARGRLEVFKGGVLFAGDSGTVDINGEGTRLMWVPEKAAFRAGEVNGTQWDLDNIGDLSIALGVNTMASGTAATSSGIGTEASGTASTAMGRNAKATNESATAMGNNTEASGHSSIAMGFQTQALAERSTAMGDKTIANGSAATAMGLSTEASNIAATAMGNLTKARGFASLATGGLTEAIGVNSTAMGSRSVARANSTIAIGRHAKANHASAIVIAANDNASTSDSIASSANEQMVLRADGNFFFCNEKVEVPNESDKLLNTSTGAFLSTGGAWTNASDRNLKENFASLDATILLEKLKALEITQWNYKAEADSITHIGPMAQNFYHLYRLGNDDKSIATVDGIGVALATIQVLAEKNERLETRVEVLEKLVQQLLSVSKVATPRAGNE